MARTHFFALIVAGLLFFFIIEAIRRRKLQERYSLLWLLVVASMVTVAVYGKSLTLVSRLVGIYYPPAALFLLALIFVVVLLLHFSLVISRLSEQSRILAQKLALLENQLAGDSAPSPANTAAPKQTRAEQKAEESVCT